MNIFLTIISLTIDKKNTSWHSNVVRGYCLAGGSSVVAAAIVWLEDPQ